MQQINLLADENEPIKEGHFADQIEMTFSGRGPADGNQQMEMDPLGRSKSFPSRLKRFILQIKSK